MNRQAPTRKCIVLIGAGRTGRALCQRLPESWEVVVLDLDPERLAKLRAEVPAQRPLRLLQRDGTSLLNLREAGLAGAEWVAALTGDDQVNIEVCRLALSIEQPPAAVGLVSHEESVAQLKALGAEALGRPAALAGLVVNLIESGLKVAVNVGLGRGEVVEIPVLPSSPAADARVADLRARRWLVAAVYRGDQILVPHGDMIIRSGDRLLLSGEPDILPHIADHLRAGVARFPLQYGAQLATLIDGSEGEAYWSEVAYLASRTRISGVTVVAAPDFAPGNRLDPVPTRLAALPARADRGAFLRREASRLDCGCLVVRKHRPGLLSRIGLLRPSYARLLDALPAPVLLAAGTHPYQRLLLPVTDSRGTTLSAELAIDLSRQLGVPISAVSVTPPAFVVGQEAVDDQKRALQNVTQVAALYHLRIELLHVEGNPAVEIARLAGPGDLLVLASRAGRRPSLFSPDTSLLLCERVPCSVLCLSYFDREARYRERSPAVIERHGRSHGNP